jgi:thioredoxin reductase (NADPH)
MTHTDSKTDSEQPELIIIGAGPAGLAAAQYGARANLKVLVLEQMAPGGQALNIDVLENYPGIAPNKSGFDFSADMHKQAEDFGAQFLTEPCTELRKDGDVFVLTLGNGETRTCPALILATGAQHRKLGIPGEDAFYGRGVSYCATCDGPFFKGKKIYVVGGGDAACDEAQYLSRLTGKVVMIHRRDKFRAQKSLAQRALRNPNIEVCFNTVMQEIKGTAKVGSVVLEETESGERREEAADAVFVFAGTIPQTQLAPGAQKDEAGYIVTDQNLATSIPGLYAAGDVRATPFRQVITAAADGAIAAHCAAAYIDELKGEAY